MLVTFNTYLKMVYKNDAIYKRVCRDICKYKTELINNVSDNVFQTKFVNKMVKYRENKLYVYIIEEDSNIEVMGFVVIRLMENNASSKKYMLSLLSVRKEDRHRGVGSSILNELFACLKKGTTKEVFIHLHASNNSLNFYLKNGFILTNDTSYIDGYESLDEEDTIVMKKV